MKKTVAYMCDYCSMPKTYPGSDEREMYFCPDCGHEMWYMGSDDIDEETGLAVKRYKEEIRESSSPQFSATGDDHIIQCPKCQNRKVRKVRFIEKFVSIITLGILFTRQPFKCKNCGYSWGKR